MKALKIADKIQKIETELICFGSNSKLENEQRKLANKLARKVKKMHKGKALSEKEVMENRSSAYEFIEFDKEETIEYDLLQHIKFCLECKNESLAIRIIEQYGFVKQQEMNSVLDEYITLLKSTTEFEVLQSFRDKVEKLENLKK